MRNSDFLATRNATPDEVLAFFRDQYRHTWFAEHSPPSCRTRSDIWEIGLHTTVGKLRSGLKLPERAGYGKALNRIFGLSLDKAQWEEVLKPANKRTLRKLCNEIAGIAAWPTVESVTICGVTSLASGAFLAIRSTMAREGYDVANIRPSTRLRGLPDAELSAAIRAVDFLAPGLLPNPEFHKTGFIRHTHAVHFGRFQTFRDLARGIVQEMRNRQSPRAISRGDLISTQAAKPEEILEILRAAQSVRGQGRLAGEGELTADTSVSQWIRILGLRDVFELEAVLSNLCGLRLAKGHWGRILRPEKEKLIGGICTAISSLYERPAIAPYAIAGRSSMAAGAYLTLRALLIRRGIPADRLTLDSRISQIDRTEFGAYWAALRDTLLVLAPAITDRIKRKQDIGHLFVSHFPFSRFALLAGISFASMILLWLVGWFDPALVAALQGMSPVSIYDALKWGMGIGVAPLLAVPAVFSVLGYLGIPEYRIEVAGVRSFRDLAALLAEYESGERGA